MISLTKNKMMEQVKTHDRVEWEYVQGVILQLVFLEDWVSLVTSCVNSMSFQMKVNGNCYHLFVRPHGLGRGPYFFLPFSSLYGEGP